MEAMRRSKSEIYLHLVWRTWQNEPLLTPGIERAVYRCIEEQAERLKCVVLAIGGMPDHLHLAVRVPTTVSAAKLAQQVKGVSSTLVRDQLRPGTLFRWQEGFGVFSVSRSHVPRVVAYIENQHRHHGDSTTWPDWEETDEENTIVDDAV